MIPLSHQLGRIVPWDARRDLFIAPTTEEAIAFAATHWIHTAARAIQQRGRFMVALSGGSTPKAIYQKIASAHSQDLDWEGVHLFWSDERCVPPEHPDSNYKMAMESGFQKLPIPPSQIHRMKGELNPKVAAAEYQDLIQREHTRFDLVMLGVGEDGHTASLFPKTAALQIKNEWVAPNFINEKKSWRLTLTYPAIHASPSPVFYALGEGKQAIIPLVLQGPIVSPFPASAVGTEAHKALWILDKNAAHLILQTNK